jgi:hypothetical protein
MKLILLASVVIFNNMAALAEPSLPVDVGSVKHGCVKPPLPRGAQKMTDAELLKFVAQLDVYTTCIQTFSLDQQSIAVKHSKAAQAAIAVADAAVNEYNEFVDAAERVTGRK